MPSLGTATKLARGLREIREEGEGPAYFATRAPASSSPRRASNTPSAVTTSSPRPMSVG